MSNICFFVNGFSIIFYNYISFQLLYKRVWDFPTNNLFVYTNGNLAKNISLILVLFAPKQYKKKSDIFICH